MECLSGTTLIASAWLAVGRISCKSGCGRLAARADRNLGKARARRQTRSDLY